ncbi:Nucleotide-binding universal stress protein, UspA family [Actinopolymorpha cephalotaxi]|uniref:Nucleotide-binding universal stress UspA family protein n=1 Tax=Actinopolymorpha cephalotaxi TaxID=504797 RepID=A0A1I3A4P7_9ACTN|nr:universal stress protein [Actinopolymorpha cephalotaxi]NYH85385.1 nucleotide-binding universal stress UspA family protein [Actinopolymorpha cephalotaxi]SFH44251.1 Nucleotide-binding universal stress protein, UspA family [Actinopolymorpha cephalotaxi]
MTEVRQPPQPRIVVGVDGSEVSVDALRWALRQAQISGGVAEAVCVWDLPTAYTVGPTVFTGEDFADAAERSLAAAVEQVAAVYPDVLLESQVQRGHAAEVLLDRAKNADLLVVGSRGHGGFVGTLLGSVSLQCVQHAPCPVVVVRSGATCRSDR